MIHRMLLYSCRKRHDYSDGYYSNHIRDGMNKLFFRESF